MNFWWRWRFLVGPLLLEVIGSGVNNRREVNNVVCCGNGIVCSGLDSAGVLVRCG